jgi:lysophospholipase L1-like esterase
LTVRVDTDSDRDARYGVLAFGDSITNGGGELQWGVALQSWALWVARALGMPYSGYAFDGAVTADVMRAQVPLFERTSTLGAEARFDVGCLYIGVNDVRNPAWDAAAFERDYRAALRYLAGRADRTLVLTVPLGLGLPRAGTKVADANAVIEDAAREHGALVGDLSGVRARNHVMADRVHPTALGQIAIAQRALAVLARDGLPVRVAPSELISYRTTWHGRLRGDWTYAYRSAKLAARAWARAR